MDTIDSVAVADEPDRIAAGTWGEPRAYILLPLFLVVAFLMTFRSFGRLDTHIVGNSGDPLLILWILGWVQHAIPHGWDAVWNTSMFFPEPNTLAYSDSMLSVAIVEWPLRYVLGEALGLNVLTLAAQTASLWFMYQLTLRLTRSWPAAVVSALAFQFASPLMSHVAHYQLTLTAFLVPLTLLVLVRYLETWAMRFGVGVGLSLAALTTSATYYGLMVASAIPVVVAGYFVWYRPKPIWTFLRGLVVGAGVAAAITLPVAVQYLDLQDDSYFRRSFDPVVAAHPSDFLSPDQDNYLLTELWPFEQHAFDRTLENRLFPGMVVTGFGIAGVVVLVRAIRRCRGENDENGAGHEERAGPPSVDECWRSRIGILIAGSGVVTLILSFGDEMSIGGADVPLPFKVLRDVVPGFSGIRATSRFVVMTVCALAVCAGFGVAAIMRRTSRRGSVVLLAVLCGLVIAETAIAIPLVRVPDGRVAESVADLLDDRPDGVVAELPTRGPLDGPLWAYLEAPRQLVSLDDTNDRVNGYSGYAPEGFDELVEELNTFPEPRALRALARHDVRYVVLRTRVLGEQEPGIAEALQRDGVGRYTPASARDLIERLPEDRVRRVTRVPGAYVVELTRA